MTRSVNNAKTRKNVLRSVALAAVVALGAALPFAGPAAAHALPPGRGSRFGRRCGGRTALGRIR